MEQQHSRLAPISRSIFSTLTAALISMPLYATAADFGVLKGTITDRNDGEPVIGASVMLENTTIGAASDFDGNYSIMEIPAGTYSLKVSGVGYAPLVQKVTVPAGETATLNLQLGQTTIMASEVVVGAALYEQDRLDIPVTASVVSEEEIKEEPSATLDDAIENVPGVVVNRSAGMGTATVQIRGSNTFNGGGIGTRVQGLYDGFPINTPVTGEIVWHNVNMNAASKVEVLKGAAATLYGSGAMGGVVNVQGSMPEEFEVKGGFSGGFYDSPPDSDKSDYYANGYTPWFWNTYFGIGDKRGALNYSFLYSHSDDDGYKENSQFELNDLKFKARYDFSSSDYLQVTSFYSETEAGYAQTWPFGLDQTMSYNIPYSDYAFDQVGDYVNTTGLPVYSTAPVLVDDNTYDDDVIKRKNGLVGLNYVNMLNDNLSIDTKLYYTRNENRIEYNPSGAAEYSGPTLRRAVDEFNEDVSDRVGAGIKLDYKASNQHRILFGMDANLIDVQSTQYTDEIPDPNPTTDDALHGIQERNLAFFLQDEIKATDKFTVLASIRYDWSGISADNVSYLDYSTYMDQTDRIDTEIENSSVDAISPRLALNYRATDDMAFRASWSRSFRAPTLSERFVRDAGLWDGNPNPELDKETLTAYEIGMFTKLSDRVSLDIAAYLNYYDDLIESQFIDYSDVASIPSTTLKRLSTTDYFTYTNLNEARIWGIETALNIKPIDPVNVALTYSYMNAKDTSYEEGINDFRDENPDPEWLPMRPEHTGSLSVTWKPDSKLSLNTTARAVSKYKAVNAYTNEEGTDYPGGFMVVNAGAKYQFTDFLSGSFLCKNITNRQYEEAEWFRAPGRSYVFGMDFVF